MQMAKVFGLMTIMTVLFVIAGDYIGGSSMAAVFFGISMVMNFWTFWFSDFLYDFVLPSWSTSSLASSRNSSII